MNELMIFNNSEFGEVRTVSIDNEPWFVGKDVADALGYDQTSNMVKRLDEEDFMSSKLDGMNMKSTLINESGLYAAVIGSQLPSAKKFKKWVTSEILPQIRKTGSYSPDVAKLPPELQLMNALVQQINKQALDQKKLEGVIQDTKEEIQEMRDVIEIQPFDNWREDTSKQINKICQRTGDYREIRVKIYEALDKRAGTKIKIRLENMKARALVAGMTRSKVDALGYLDVIAEDKKLIEIYTAIVKEMAIKKGVA